MVQRSRSEGANCSCETWYPKRAIFSQFSQIGSVGTSTGHWICCRYSRSDAQANVPNAGRMRPACTSTLQRKRPFLSAREARPPGILRPAWLERARPRLHLGRNRALAGQNIVDVLQLALWPEPVAVSSPSASEMRKPANAAYQYNRDHPRISHDSSCDLSTLSGGVVL